MVITILFLALLCIFFRKQYLNEVNCYWKDIFEVAYISSGVMAIILGLCWIF